MMEVNKRAPVVAASEIEVAAAPEIVWDLIADIDGWPRWNPAVKEASLSGGLTEGSTFRWKAGSGAITSRFRRLERPRLVGWTGKTFGIYAIHVYRLEPRDGHTIVSTAVERNRRDIRAILGCPQQLAAGGTGECITAS